MSQDTLDEVDRGILHLLQQDARNVTTTEIGDAVGVSASTVGNRLRELREKGVIDGYYPQIDYHDAGFPLRVLFICTAPIPDREALAERALDAPGVVTVKEIMAGVENLHVEAVATTRDDVADVARKLDELGLEVVEEVLVKNEHVQPFDHFGSDTVSE
ncbi:transcriptional regulator [Haladaptatus sp. W1]|uniref:Lrp/AsnC family transcriptional regulator n=1 Tax=Haladaptatus sp. W1 TaxID=1897478 RepID=UPI000849EA5C|nr:Lrp/AsnC family transcriptional regulator [Haladaptatus sp. W1]ODR80323.1 transcriptional regulator [Haladaptatus sp. W1]